MPFTSPLVVLPSTIFFCTDASVSLRSVSLPVLAHPARIATVNTAPAIANFFKALSIVCWSPELGNGMLLRQSQLGYVTNFPCTQGRKAHMYSRVVGHLPEL